MNHLLAATQFRKLLFLLLWLGGMSTLNAQNWDFTFGGKVTEFVEEKQKDMALELVTIIVARGTTVVSSTSTQSNGKFKCRIPGNGDYLVTVSKPGYISKRFAINTMNVPAERTNYPFGQFDVDIELFKTYPGLDYSVLDKPIARIVYTPELEDFDYEKAYTEKIRAELEKLKELARLAKEKERLYKAALAKGDKAFGTSDWTNAKLAYTEALAIKPDEKYPKDQITECDKRLGAASASAANEQKYKELIIQADGKFNGKDWQGAKSLYQQASQLKAAEQYPKDRIIACDKNIGDAAMAAAGEQKYKELIAQADKLFAASNWAEAKTAYQQALSLKTTEKYPKDQIEKCDKNSADAADSALKEKQYQDLITEANARFGSRQWAAAKEIYQQALKIKENEAYPKERIQQCDQNITDESAAADREKKYASVIAQADLKFKASDWKSAKDFYGQALQLKPLEKYPQDQLAICNQKLKDTENAELAEQRYKQTIDQADSRFNAADWSGAKTLYQQASAMKPAEQYPKDRIAECDKKISETQFAAELEKSYAAAIAKADAAYKSESYEAARTSYIQARDLKPKEKYPQEQITTIDKLLADRAKADAIAKQYTDLIKQADQKFEAKSWASARSLYAQASELKQSEQYPKDRIKICDENLNNEKSLAERNSKYKEAIAKADAAFGKKDYATAKTAYTEASGLMSTEQYPKDQLAIIAKIEADAAAVAALDKNYTDAIAKGDDAFAAKDYSKAKTAYQLAISIKSKEQYPKDRVTECDKRLNEAKSAAELDAKYNAAIAKADAAFGEKKYDVAKTAYTDAGTLKPSESYPKDRIAEIDRLLAEANAANAAERQYNTFIQQADAKFQAKDWKTARGLYQQAADVKPALQYPKDRIALCDDALTKELDAAALNQKYRAAITKADAAFKIKDYETAQTAYTEASNIKSEEKYPKDQLAAIGKLIADIQKGQEIEAKYKAAIAKADAGFAGKNYTVAKADYTEASSIKPSETYPKTKIAEIDRILAADAAVATKEKQFTAYMSAGDSSIKATNYANAKSSYQQALKLKPTDQQAIAKLAEAERLYSDQKFEEEKQKKYNALIAKADKAMQDKDYGLAKSTYTEAVTVKQMEVYPKQKLAEIDLILNPKPDPTANKNNTTNGNANNDEYKAELAKKYPQGLTEEIVKEGGGTTINRIVVVGKDGWAYTKKTYAWGGVYYFKNGQQISETTFNYETSAEYIQSLQAKAAAKGSGQ